MKRNHETVSALQLTWSTFFLMGSSAKKSACKTKNKKCNKSNGGGAQRMRDSTHPIHTEPNHPVTGPDLFHLRRVLAGKIAADGRGISAHMAAQTTAKHNAARDNKAHFVSPISNSTPKLRSSAASGLSGLRTRATT
jgi:hypothetical protein